MTTGSRHALAMVVRGMSADHEGPAEILGVRLKFANVNERNDSMKNMKNILMRLWKEEEGQDLLEYALLIVLVVLVAAAAINPLGASIAAVYTAANACITTFTCAT
jgi:Flp pilus assembly pilin Flp